MACRVLIDSVLVTPLVAGESHLQEVTVAGRAEGCSRVRVVLQCTEAVSYVLDVDENGLWGGRFDVKAALCECGEPSLLVARCADDPDCQSDAVEINQRCPTPPGPCPVILNIIPAVASTCTDGKRSVTFTADIRVGTTPVPDSAIQFYRWEFGDNSPAVSRTAGEGAGPVSHAYAAGTDQTYTVTLTLLGTGYDESNLPCMDTFAVSVTVPACGCPTVTDIEVTPGDCSGDGTHRSVSLKAIVSGQAEEFVWNFGDGLTATVPAGSGGEERIHTYAAPGTYVVSVTARSPGCPDRPFEKTVTVQGCPRREEPPVEDPPDDPPDRSRFDFCSILTFLMLVGAGLFVVGAYLAMCPAFFGYSSDPRVIYAIAAGLVIIGAAIFLVSLVLWWILCRPTLCRWVSLAWKIFFLTGMAVLYYLFCTPCAPLALLGAGLLLSGALLTFLYWLRECRPDACTIFNELVLVMVALDMVTLLEIILGGCVLTNNWWGALFWVVLIASLNLVAVAGQQRYCRLPRSGP